MDKYQTTEMTNLMDNKAIKELCRTEGQDALKHKILILDFAAYFPYYDQSTLHFKLSLGSESINQKLNHRYPNKSYMTISKVYENHKVSKLGCPVIINEEDLTNDKYNCLLNLEMGDNNGYVTVIFPIEIDFSNNKQVAYLRGTWKYDAEKPQICLETYKKADDIGYHVLPYTYQLSDKDNLSFHKLNNNTAVCNQSILVEANSLENAWFYSASKL